jgi:hypothetical protein
MHNRNIGSAHVGCVSCFTRMGGEFAGGFQSQTAVGSLQTISRRLWGRPVGSVQTRDSLLIFWYFKIADRGRPNARLLPNKDSRSDGPGMRVILRGPFGCGLQSTLRTQLCAFFWLLAPASAPARRFE